MVHKPTGFGAWQIGKAVHADVVMIQLREISSQNGISTKVASHNGVVAIARCLTHPNANRPTRRFGG
jgi:hypothetical protein